MGEWDTGVRGTDFSHQGNNGDFMAAFASTVSYSIQNQFALDRIGHSWGLN